MTPVVFRTPFSLNLQLSARSSPWDILPYHYAAHDNGAYQPNDSLLNTIASRGCLLFRALCLVKDLVFPFISASQLVWRLISGPFSSRAFHRLSLHDECEEKKTTSDMSSTRIQIRRWEDGERTGCKDARHTRYYYSYCHTGFDEFFVEQQSSQCFA